MAKANTDGCWAGSELRMGARQAFSGAWRAQLMSWTELSVRGDTGDTGDFSGPVPGPQHHCLRADPGGKKRVPESPPTQTHTR